MEISHVPYKIDQVDVRENIMLDLETYGKAAGCPILSIGAVYFDEKGVSEQGFYVVINLDSCYDIGLVTNDETVQWWEQQSLEAREVILKASDNSGMDNLPIKEALAKFNEFVQLGGRKVKVWGNGADFDQAIIQYAYARAGMNTAWDFWNNRCYRTLKSFNTGIRFVRMGTFHNALFDAASQAHHAAKILAHINGAIKPKDTLFVRLTKFVKKILKL